MQARRVLHGLLLVLLLAALPAPVSAALIDVWRAADLNLLDDSDPVGSWTSRSNRLATAPVGDMPLFRKNATPAGEPVVHFDFNRMTVPSSPVAGMNTF